MEFKDPISMFKAGYSVVLLIFSVSVIMGLIANKQTELSSEVSSALSYFTIWGAVIWLTMIEGGQASLVGLAPVKMELYKTSHPIAHKIGEVAYTGDNLDRYLLGRQFMVVGTVFIINMSGAPIEGAELWGLPDIITDIFLGSGLAMILLTCMVGQLNTQVNASHCMLDYIDNFFGYFTFWVAMAIEFSGLLHAAYVVQIIVASLAGKTIESNEPPRTFIQNVFFWARCVMSIAILCFCFAVTFEALFDDKTTMWEGVPPELAVVVFIILMCVVGMLEGMQIAFFAVAKLTEDERGDSAFAKKTCNLIFTDEGTNLPGFMIGRQLCVVSCMFFVARVASVKLEDGEENIFGVNDSLQELFNTGLLGAHIVTIVGSISWQLVASAFPLSFLSNPLTYFLLRLCLFLESTGVCAGAWVLAAIHKKIASYNRDEFYIGTAEERAKTHLKDDGERLHVGVGHLVKLPGFLENAPPDLVDLLRTDPIVAMYVNRYMDDIESVSVNSDITNAS